MYGRFVNSLSSMMSIWLQPRGHAGEPPSTIAASSSS
jgi:hypothetical protein